jgi:mannosyltransferase
VASLVDGAAEGRRTAAAVARVRALRTDELLASRWSTPALLTVLTALSLLLRTRQLNGGFWIDEGLSVGIAHHPLTAIPGLLRQDGSPPAYYLLLGVWIRLFGDGERATHTLSLVFAVGCIPLAFAVGRSLFGRSTGLLCAALAAIDPYLTYYAQETRMYSLEAFLSLLVVLAYVNGIIRGRRPWVVVFVLSLDAMLYVHNWALFLCVGLAAATALVARERLRLFGVAAAGVAVLYAPWLPILLSQVRHTGAPWTSAPSFHDLVLAPGVVFNGDAPLMAFALVGGAGLASVLRRRGDEERAKVLALGVSAGVTVLLAWLLSQLSPAWAPRYFAVLLGPLLLLAAAGLVRARRLGLAALIAVAFVWLGYSVNDNKENARQVSAALAPSLRPGELVISTHPEQVPLLRYYLGVRPRFATTLGPVADPQVFDWRDAVDRLRATQPRPTLAALLASVQPGSEFVVVTPVFRDYRAWKAQWTHLVWQRSLEWSSLLQHDPSVRLVRHVSTDEIALHRNYFKPLQAFVYRRLR